MFTAIVNGNGTYLNGGIERLYLHINKTNSAGLPWRVGRVAVTLVIGETEYTGELCARSDYPYLYVGSQLRDASGVSHKLTHLLLANEFRKKNRTRILVEGNRLTVSRICDV